jgi:hypothetical protein
MRRACLCLLICLVAACADEDQQADNAPACEEAQKLTLAALENRRLLQPACSTDDECVAVPIKVHGGSVSLDLCSTVLHREAAAKWDPAAFGELLAMRFPAGQYGCDISASCINSVPVCRAGQCIGEDPYTRVADAGLPEAGARASRVRDAGTSDPPTRDPARGDAAASDDADTRN